MNTKALFVVAIAVATVAVILLSINLVVARIYLRRRRSIIESALGKWALAASIAALFSGILLPLFSALAIVLGGLAVRKSRATSDPTVDYLGPMFALPREDDGARPELLARAAVLNGVALLLIAGAVWLGVYFGPSSS